MSLALLFTSRANHWFLQVLIDFLIVPPIGLPIAFFTCTKAIYRGYLGGDWGRYVLDKRRDLRLAVAIYFQTGPLAFEGYGKLNLYPVDSYPGWFTLLEDQFDSIDDKATGYSARLRAWRLDSSFASRCAVSSTRELARLAHVPPSPKVHATLAIILYELVMHGCFTLCYCDGPENTYMYDFKWTDGLYGHQPAVITNYEPFSCEDESKACEEHWYYEYHSRFAITPLLPLWDFDRRDLEESSDVFFRVRLMHTISCIESYKKSSWRIALGAFFSRPTIT